jgi:hypothetical protein
MGTVGGVYQFEERGWKEEVKKRWICLKYFTQIYKNRVMKSIKIVYKWGMKGKKEYKGGEFDKSMYM